MKNKHDVNNCINSVPCQDCELAQCEDMADVCELAHNRTVIECKDKNIPIDDTSDIYSPEAQAIFDKHYDEIIEKAGL